MDLYEVYYCLRNISKYEWIPVGCLSPHLHFDNNVGSSVRGYKHSCLESVAASVFRGIDQPSVGKVAKAGRTVRP